jgi:polysaccharide biosynthesis/export protein
MFGNALRRCGIVALLAMPAHLAAEPQPSSKAGQSTPIEAYRVNPGDELDVSVWGEDRMQKSVRVLPDGTFAFPLAGTVIAAGNTPHDIAETIKARIAYNFRNAVPEVTVIVRDPAGMRFYVVGKVRAPGTFPITRSIDVLQALSMAGGVADFADVSHAVLLRQTAAGQVVLPVDFSRVLKGGHALDAGLQGTALPTLAAGDVLVIP